ncbi:cation diffusion facilitator family transporter [Bacillus thermotolerans]|uniref:Cobalt-zinc-cadmium resistance protein n=1 Tax=Bacillus thermotolerans TaxID=1221996 RepID=A0A0F5HP08_BACTR|nr:cation diffusion facilitator family transporter [Bacillus thermotolerans]KKB35026.1 Cobalt-zinc-cadmium resistance protein [Bacillus thermotolerans]KKB39962.1 Cobalt-zinc-cadmium resistance protein [Bacillus thermotolerans]
MEDKQEYGEKGAWLSLGAYIVLSILKMAVGLMTNSKALVADGLNNTTDILVSISILIGLKISKKPPDDNHPYGHYRAETIASLIASFIMASVGIQVIVETFKHIISPLKESPDLLSAWVAVICAIVMYAVYRYNKRLAKKVNSPSLLAAAKDNLSDSWVSIGAAVGIIGSQFSMPWLDPLAGLIVGAMICKTAWDIFWESSHSLTDGFQKSELNEFRKTIKSVDGVKLISDIKARTLGNQIFVDVVIKVHPNLDVIEGNKIAKKVEKIMKEKHLVNHTHIHIEPVTYIKVL